MFRYNRYHGNAVKGFWALWDNVYEFVCCYNRCHSDAVLGFGPYWVIFMTVCVYCFKFSHHS
jgi:hypothetical protein